MMQKMIPHIFLTFMAGALANCKIKIIKNLLIRTFIALYKPNLEEAMNKDIAGQLGLEKIVRPVGNTRSISKHDMFLNDALPDIQIDPETYTVTADGEVLTCEPATTLPLAQRYFLF